MAGEVDAARRRPVRTNHRAGARCTAATVACLGALSLLAACDTGDGKTLRNTVVPTTLPPPDTAPLESTALDGALDGAPASGQLPSVTLDVGSSAGAPPTDPIAGEMQLVAPWNDGTAIDGAYTCDGDDTSPPLSWRNVPEGTAELALSVIDVSADSSAGPFVHWIVAGIDPSRSSLLAGAVPDGVIQATNSFGDVGWGGPCPPAGDQPHEYRFMLHALAQQVELGDGVPASEALPYVIDLTTATAEITGTYAR
jgi:Raf kinase inhibitor-like YbhB/YbcL family protein